MISHRKFICLMTLFSLLILPVSAVADDVAAPQAPQNLKIRSPLGYNTDTLRSGGGIIVHIVCVGWTAAERSDAETAGADINDKAFSTTGTTPEKNPFFTYRSEFTVYRTTIDSPVSGQSITDAQFQDTVSAAETAGGFTNDFMLIRENISDQNVQGNNYSLHGNGLQYEIDNSLTGAPFAYVAAHELAHLVSYKWTTHEPVDSYDNVAVIGDEYTNSSSLCYGMSRYYVNIHDKLNNEKWSDLVSTEPVLGGEYCDRYLFRPESNCWMRETSTQSVGFCPVCRANLTYAIQKHNHYSSPLGHNPPTITMDGTNYVENNGSYTGQKTITVNVAAVASGANVYKVEWYISHYDTVNQTSEIGSFMPHSVYIDHSGNATSTWVWDTTKYPSTGPNGYPEYSITIILYDTYYNSSKKTVYGMNVSNPILGEGCTTAYVIDRDCDGYGVSSKMGPDADDTDKDINNPFTIWSDFGTGGKFDSLNEFLATKNITCDRKFYIDTKYGTKSGTVNNINAPYDQWESMRALIDSEHGQPGDCIILRGYDGYTYSSDSNFIYFYGTPPDGTAEKPITILPYPGEKVNISAPRFYSNSSTDPTKYWTINGMGGGFYLPYNLGSTPLGQRISFGQHEHFNIYETEIENAFWGISGFVDLHHINIERNVIHSNSSGDEHLIYLGSRGPAYPSSDGANTDIVIRQNIFYAGAGSGAVHHNGPIDGLLIDKNISHTNKTWTYGILNGGTNITFTNNVDFNNWEFIRFFWYNSDTGGGSVASYPSPLVNLTISNNSIYHASDDSYATNDYAGNYSSIFFNDYIDFNSKTETWTSSTSYDSDVRVTPTIPNGCFYESQASGTSGSTEPSWATTSGDLIIDNDIRWTAVCHDYQGLFSNNIITNNIFQHVGRSATTGPIFYWTSGINYMFDTDTTAPTISYNDMYREDGEPYYAGFEDGAVKKSFSDFEAYDTVLGLSDKWHDNYNADVGYVAASNSYVTTPWKFDLHTGPYPKNKGTETGAPADDITKKNRLGHDLGAYDY